MWIQSTPWLQDSGFNDQQKDCFQGTLGVPQQAMVYNEKNPIKTDDLGVSLCWETSKKHKQKS